MKVAFIGLGDIGLPMALRLGDAGFAVRGVDPDEAARRRFAEAGGTVADNGWDAADSDVICLAVPDDAAVETVLLRDGLLARLGPDSAVLIHSTILPPTAVRIAERAADGGVHVLDAPVSGGAARARTGALSLMVGGDVPEGIRPVLAALGRTVETGPAGSGAALKLANQLAMFATIQAVYEGSALAARYGVAQATVLEALSDSTGDSWVVRNWGFMERLARAYDVTGTDVVYRPWSKDLWDIVATARSARIAAPLAALLSQIHADEVERRAHEQEGS